MAGDESAGVLAALREAVRTGQAPDVATRQALGRLDDPAALRTAGRILAKLPAQGNDLRPLRVGVLATFTLGSFEYLLRAALVGAGAQPSIACAEYGSFEMSLATSGFPADGDPDVMVCLLAAEYFLPSRWSAGDVTALVDHLDARLDRLRELVSARAGQTRATLVLHTVPLPAEVRDALISWRARAEVSAAWHRMNAAILELAAAHRQVAVVDLTELLADCAAPARDDRLHRYADMPYTDPVLLLLAQQVRRIAQARLGLSRRVLALDLDNTLWGGVLGEVGAGGVQLGGLYPGACYTDLQHAAARLRDQGIILALASKNDADLVNPALAEHPEMVLRPEAFSAQAVNWAPKSENLRRMAQTLSLATGSFVFLDDSAFERGEVGAELPDVAVLAADGDPAHLTRTLLRHGWFDVLELTDTDRDRPRLYRTRSQRAEHSVAFATPEEYLRALDIEVTGAPVTGYTVPRAAQLAARTNQFNLTGLRFDEATTAALGADPDHLVAVFTVADRFGDEGIVGAVWVDVAAPEWRIANLVLSCRVLGRGVEFAVIEWIARRAAAAGAERLAARFVRTDRNGAVDGFLDKAGFPAPGEDDWCAVDLAGRPDNFPAWIRLRDDEQ